MSDLVPMLKAAMLIEYVRADMLYLENLCLRTSRLLPLLKKQEMQVSFITLAKIAHTAFYSQMRR